jgi:hypothetical protein
VLVDEVQKSFKSPLRSQFGFIEQDYGVKHWSYARVSQVLRKLFPKVFHYLDASQEEKPPWRLLNKSGQVLTVVDIACPTGTDLAKHKGRDKASVTDSHLWFGAPIATIYTALC